MNMSSRGRGVGNVHLGHGDLDVLLLELISRLFLVDFSGLKHGLALLLESRHLLFVCEVHVVLLERELGVVCQINFHLKVFNGLFQLGLD